jgi:mono/diheme cytochrome c family protein
MPLRSFAAVLTLGSLVVVLAAGCSHGTSSTSTASATATATATPAITGNAGAGKQTFAANCSACHGATGVEGGVGPSLKNERARKNQAAAIAWIKDPQPPMPKLYPSPLTDADVANLAAYVESL